MSKNRLKNSNYLGKKFQYKKETFHNGTSALFDQIGKKIISF